MSKWPLKSFCLWIVLKHVLLRKQHVIVCSTSLKKNTPAVEWGRTHACETSCTSTGHSNESNETHWCTACSHSYALAQNFLATHEEFRRVTYQGRITWHRTDVRLLRTRWKQSDRVLAKETNRKCEARGDTWVGEGSVSVLIAACFSPNLLKNHKNETS